LPTDSKPKNARSKRQLDKKAPQVHENPKMTLFLRYTSCSEIVQLAMNDLHSLKRPLAHKFSKKNDIHPFEDASSLEFFAQKNDTSLMCFGSHSKKRPHTLTFCRFFDFKVLEMLELHIDVDSFRTLSQFKSAKARVGLKPLVSFSGTAFDSPVSNNYTMAKSLLLDFFKGEDTNNVDVEGLQYMVHISVAEEEDAQAAPKIQLRTYMISTKKSGQSLPRVELEEMGPRIDFRVGRVKEADADMMKDALKKPKGLEVFFFLFSLSFIPFSLFSLYSFCISLDIPTNRTIRNRHDQRRISKPT
jgi:ribosome production factor 2